MQGIVGSMPWNAMVFITLWLQLLGFSDFAASLLMALFALGSALGGLLGGAIGMTPFRRQPAAVSAAGSLLHCSERITQDCWHI